MAKLKQGQIRWANLPHPAGRRPVVILTRTDALAYITNVSVAPLTRTVRNISSEVILGPSHGVPTVCAVSLDNILTVKKESLADMVTTLDSQTLGDVFRAIQFAFAIPG